MVIASDSIQGKFHVPSLRKSYSRIPDAIAVPNLIRIQLDSYEVFKNEGLRDLLHEISPIQDFTGNRLEMRFTDYSFGDPKYTQEECRERDATYAAPLRVIVQLLVKETGEVKEQEIFMGDFPLMTHNGTFIVNGAERVVVSQLVRSPGVYLTLEQDHTSGRDLCYAKLIPNRGAWLEFETSNKNVISVKVDRKRKIPITTLLRAIGGGSLLVAFWLGCSWRARPAVPVAGQYAPGSLIVATIVLSAAGAAALSGWTSTNVFEGLPHQPDEVVYRLQSEWILSGRLAGERPLCPDHFEIPFTYFRGDLWIGHYPPAWPLILAPGVALNIAWLVPAALRFAFVVLVGMLGWQLAGRWAGAGAALLAATSPLATLLFASTMPHAGSATLLLAGLFLCLPRHCEETSLRWVVAGAAFGVSFAIRPLTTVAYAIPLGVFLLHEATVGRRRARELICVVAGGLSAVGPALAANAFLTGSPWQFPYSLADGPMVSPDHLMFGIRNVDAILASLVPMLHGWGWPWLPDPALLTLPLAFVAVPFLSGSATREEKLLLALATSVVMVNIVAQASGLHGFGPRYAFAACAPLWILTASGVTRLARLEHRRLPAAQA